MVLKVNHTEKKKAEKEKKGVGVCGEPPPRRRMQKKRRKELVF